MLDKATFFSSIDIETTGLDKNAEIIEIGAVKVKNNRIVGRFQTFVAASAPIPQQITTITNITDNDLIGAPDIRIALIKLKYFIGTMPLIGYNIRFDMEFLKKYGCKNGILFQNKTIDVLTLAREKLHGKGAVENYKLSTIAKYFSINFIPHRASNDAETTIKIYNRLRENN